MTDLRNPPANPGGITDVIDDRDIRWEEAGKALPPLDWHAGYDIERTTGLALPVDDQDGSTSCGGQAVSKYVAVAEAVQTGSYEQRSAAYVYSQTVIRDANGSPAGSRLRDNLDLARTQGVGLESLCPSYDDGKPPHDSYILRPGLVTAEARESAKLSKALSYAYVGMSIDSCGQAIAANAGMVILLGGQDNGTWYSAFPKPPTYRQWGHFMYFGKARLRNGKKELGGLQSWGLDAGDKGWQWFGEDWFRSGFLESGATLLLDTPVPHSYRFTRDLTVGKTGADVRFLQSFLNKAGFPVALSGPGSVGQETDYFGAMTRAAVARLQGAWNIKPAAGYFGPLTRAAVNAVQ